MPAAARADHQLRPHPAGTSRVPAGAFDGLKLCLHSTFVSDALHLAYGLEGDLERLLLPAPSAPGRSTGRLWEHSCFELFVAAGSAGRYAEYNFAPTLQWAAYAFGAYREPDLALQPLLPPPQLGTQRGAGWLQLDVVLHVPTLQAALGTEPLRFAATAVLETVGGDLTYWATAHTDPRKADFHRADSFTLALAE